VETPRFGQNLKGPDRELRRKCCGNLRRRRVKLVIEPPSRDVTLPRGCGFRVIHVGLAMSEPLPLYPDSGHRGMSQRCHRRTTWSSSSSHPSALAAR
jgi:hypothetical protein